MARLQVYWALPWKRLTAWTERGGPWLHKTLTFCKPTFNFLDFFNCCSVCTFILYEHLWRPGCFKFHYREYFTSITIVENYGGTN